MVKSFDWCALVSGQFELPLPIARHLVIQTFSPVSTGSDVQFRLPLALPQSTVHSLCIANNTFPFVWDCQLEFFTALCVGN
jgi:hypothetical protein